MSRPILGVLLLAIAFPVRAQNAHTRADSTAEVLSPWLVSNGLAVRRADGLAILHIARRGIAAQGGRTVADLLRRTPGVMVRSTPDGGMQIILAEPGMPGAPPCPIVAFLNGSAIDLGRFNAVGDRVGQMASRSLRIDDVVRLPDLDAVELYSADTSPVLLPADCGVLLLWSERLRSIVDESFVGRVSGVVLEEFSTSAVPGARVALRPLGAVGVTDASGRFSFDAVPAGRYELSVEVDGAPPWTAKLDVKAFTLAEIHVGVEVRRLR